jgi:hypothetical protein
MLPRLAAVLLVAAVAAPAAAGPDDDKIKKAIRGGQSYLQAIYKHGGRAPGGGLGDFSGGQLLALTGGNGCGPAALSGLALLETGVPATDPSLVNIERGLRASAFSTKATYELSLLIMFFDRLGRKEDRPMIQFLTVRLMTGQLPNGCWTYACDGLALDAANERLIGAELTRDVRIATPPERKDPGKEGRPRTDLDAPPPAKKDAPKPEPKKGPAGGLHSLVEKLLSQARPVTTIGWSGDHSNTQFATVALWVGRRHHVPVDGALKLMDKHYRAIQGGDGGWGYITEGGPSSAPMTCAGLMGLAMAYGARLSTQETKAPREGADAAALLADKQVANALKYLGQYLAVAANQAPVGSIPGYEGGGLLAPNEMARNLYFMWSVERVGMVYGLTTVGNVNWYEWGSKALCDSQQRDGSWSDGSGHGTVENATAFALLFLGRANAAEDLSTRLTGKVKDPGTSRLQGGNTPELVGKESMSSSPKKPAEGSTTVKTPPTPTAKADPAAPLADALVKAKPAERAVLLAKYRDTKGAEYTDALVLALAKLEGTALAETRDALAQRLTRMTPATLVGLMGDKNRELRRAAALACAAKGRDRVKEFGDALIKLIGDGDPLVVQAARASLKELSGADHGPNTATPADQQQALIAWQKWWDGQK